MTLLEKYRDIFGKPYEGFHKLRLPILNLALMDVLGTILLIIVAIMFSDKMPTTILAIIIGTIFGVIFIHWLFGVRTSLNVKLGIAPTTQ